MIVYLAYYEDDRGTAMSSSFGWTSNAQLAMLYLKRHRLSRDSDCTPKLIELNCDDSDCDDIYDELRSIDFYPYTPNQDYDSEIRIIYVEDTDSQWDTDLAVVTTYDTVYGVVESATPCQESYHVSDYWYNIRAGYCRAGYCAVMDNVDNVLKVLHWMMTGNVVKNEWVSNLLKSAIERTASTNFASYQEFNSVKYCIVTGYLMPI